MIYAEKVTINGRDWVKIYFNPLPELVYSMNKVPNATFNPKTKLWAVPYYNRVAFETIMGNHLIIWRGDQATPGGIPEESIPPTPLIDYKFKTKPYDYQIRASNLIYQRNFLLLADEMGLGKSKCTIDGIGMKKQAGMLKRGLVICKASLIYNWKDEIEKHSDLKAVIFTGTPNQRHEIINNIARDPDCTFIIVSYETFRICVASFDEFDTKIGIDFVVLDECHRIKNPNSKIGSVIHRIPIKYKYLLTGTPIPNNPLEAFNYLKLGGKLDMNWWQFRRRYGIFGGYAGKEVVGYKNINELKEVLHENMLRRLKKDKLKDLPDIVYTTIPVIMTPGQSKLYDAVRKDIIEDLKETSLDNVPNALAKLMRLQQITDAPALIESKEKSIKLLTLDDMLEDLIDDGGHKVVVFSRFRTMVNIMSKRYKKYNPAIIHGDIDSQGKPAHVAEKYVDSHYPSVSAEERKRLIKEMTTSDRQKEVYRFQNDDSCKLFLMTQAAQEGLTLTASSRIICIDSLWSPAYMNQIYARLHRIGQKNCVNVYRIVCKNTIDEKVMNVLERKDEMAQTLIDNGVKDIGANRAKEFIRSMIE
ncbi:MAG TPA: DEAD/DEAH box helicase [Thermoclostridium sp.]|nr:DEAD/DEAH box helicase [Thermoclostridium sp.]